MFIVLLLDHGINSSILNNAAPSNISINPINANAVITNYLKWIAVII
jgi:hypothetical protein